MFSSGTLYSILNDHSQIQVGVGVWTIARQVEELAASQKKPIRNSPVTSSVADCKELAELAALQTIMQNSEELAELAALQTILQNSKELALKD